MLLCFTTTHIHCYMSSHRNIKGEVLCVSWRITRVHYGFPCNLMSFFLYIIKQLQCEATIYFFKYSVYCRNRNDIVVSSSTFFNIATGLKNTYQQKAIPFSLVEIIGACLNGSILLYHMYISHFPHSFSSSSIKYNSQISLL